MNTPSTNNTNTGPPELLEVLRGLISQTRQQLLRRVDVAQVQTYWGIGRHIVEFEQGGQNRATYGKQLLSRLAESLTHEFGKGFDERNLRNMRAFFQHFPNWNAVRSELSWTHYRLLMRVDSSKARDWYTQEAAAQNWSTRLLESTYYYVAVKINLCRVIPHRMRGNNYLLASTV